jgi:hypothetical protein
VRRWIYLAAALAVVALIVVEIATAGGNGGRAQEAYPLPEKVLQGPRVDYTDQEDPARSFLQKYGWTFPVLADPDRVYGADYGFSGLPTTVVLDPIGVPIFANQALEPRFH